MLPSFLFLSSFSFLAQAGGPSPSWMKGLSCVTAGSTPRADILLGTQTGRAVSTFSCTAIREDIVVQTIELNNCVTSTPDLDGDCADLGETPGNDIAVATLRIQYVNSNGVFKTDNSAFVNGEAVFTGLDMLFLSGIPTAFTVSVDSEVLNGVQVASGDQIQVNWNTLGVFEAYGVDSNARLRQLMPQYLLASPFTIRKTRPTLTLSAGSPSGEKTPGNIEVLRYNESADSRGSVFHEETLFIVSTSDAGLTWSTCDAGQLGDPDSWLVYDLSDPSEKLDDDADWTFLDASGTGCAAGEPVEYAILNFTTDLTHQAEEIGAGSTITYVVKINTTGASEDDAIRLEIPDQAEAEQVGLDAILWDDDWVDGINGQYIKGLPVTGGDITF